MSFTNSTYMLILKNPKFYFSWHNSQSNKKLYFIYKKMIIDFFL